MTGTNTRTTAFTVRFPTDVLAEMRATAARHNVSVAMVVLTAIRLATDLPADENAVGTSEANGPTPGVHASPS
jgi:hypothetical protein